MLTQLHISNFAIIDDLVIPFGSGLNVLTGETGAGKSIIVEALGLITGDRVPADVVRTGAGEADVTAIFDSKALSKDLISVLDELGHKPDDHLVIKRTIQSSGKTRASLNGRTISLSELKKMSPYLLEISSQHEHQQLLNEETHLDLVDRFGSLEELRDVYSKGFDRYTGIKERLSELERLAVSATEQKEFLSYQVKEIDASALKEGEEGDLERERNVVKYAARLLEKVGFANEALYSSEGSVAGGVAAVNEALVSVVEIDSTVKEWLPLCEQATVAVEELSRHLQGYLDGLDVDPNRIEEIETRLFDIRRLKKKYGGTIEEILAKRDELAAKLELIENCGDEIEKAKAELKDAVVSLEKAALELSMARMKFAERLTKLVQKELDTLGLKKTTFMPGHVRLKIEEAGANGIDRFSFLISPNPGEPLKPLARIASGGELSRVMLAIKSVLMDRVAHATLEVFDEVDQGIGGAVAEMVGLKLKEMALKRQIITITHLPQVASLGGHHIVVNKRTKENRTVTSFKLLDSEDRVEEVARMLGGAKITRTTIEHAREMLVTRQFNFHRHRR